MTIPSPGCYGSVLLYAPATPRCTACPLAAACGVRVQEVRAELEGLLADAKKRLPKAPKAAPPPKPAPAPEPRKIPVIAGTALTVKEEVLLRQTAEKCKLDVVFDPAVNPFTASNNKYVSSVAALLFRANRLFDEGKLRTPGYSRSVIEAVVYSKATGASPGTVQNYTRMALNVLVATGWVIRSGDAYRWITKE